MSTLRSVSKSGQGTVENRVCQACSGAIIAPLRCASSTKSSDSKCRRDMLCYSCAEAHKELKAQEALEKYRTEDAAAEARYLHTGIPVR